MAKRSTEEVGVNMTPMIDIVFQLIIFFVVTTELDKQKFNESIILALSPHGPVIEKRDPRTVVIEVDDDGHISIAQNRMNIGFLIHALRQAVSSYGASTPVQIRADKGVKHEYVRQVMEACGQAGIWRISFVATKEEAKGGA